MTLKYFFLFIFLPIAPLAQGQIVNSSPQPTFNTLNYNNGNNPYSDSVTSHNIESKVIVRYVINEDGSIGDVQVIKGLNPDLDSEAIEMVLSMPRQKPPTQNGKYVKAYFTQPVVFKK